MIASDSILWVPLALEFDGKKAVGWGASPSIESRTTIIVKTDKHWRSQWHPAYGSLLNANRLTKR